MDTFRNTWRNKPQVIFLMIVFVILIILLLAALLLRRGVLGTPNSAQEPEQPTTIASDEATATVAGGETMPVTPTATRVVQGNSPTATPTVTATESGASQATNTPTLAARQTGPTPTPTAQRIEMGLVNLLRNGGFEQGFAADGTASGWQQFTNGGARYLFGPEGWPPAIRDGKTAQRISILDAHLSDRYAGLYQTLDVIPGETYWLVLHGQIRSHEGDIQTSKYGYRMQLAVDFSGEDSWQAIPAADWVELPWDEQLIDGDQVRFLSYSTPLAPPNSKMTVFIRAWNKWPNQAEGQYTLDTLQLLGPSPQMALVNEPLPETGRTQAPARLYADPRVWAGLLFLFFLLGSALLGSRARRQPVKK